MAAPFKGLVRYPALWQERFQSGKGPGGLPATTTRACHGLPPAIEATGYLSTHIGGLRGILRASKVAPAA